MIADQFRTPAQILEGVSAIALQIQQSVVLEDILQTALDSTRALLQTDRLLLYRFLPDGGESVAVESVGSEWAPLLGQRLDDPSVTAPWVEHYQQGYTKAIDDFSANSNDSSSTGRLTRLHRASLVVPLFVQGALWGLLIAYHCQNAHAWQPLEVQCLQMVAMQLGVAIQLGGTLQEQLIGAIAAKLPGAIYRAVYSPEGELSSLFLSEAYRRLLGRDPQALMAHPEHALELVHPDDRRRFFEAIKAASETLGMDSLEYRLMTAAGEALWVRDDAQFSRGEHGELIIDGMHLDISDRKRSEAALLESEASKSALLSALPDLIMRVDGTGHYLEFLATPTFRVVGKTVDFVGMSVYDSLPFDVAQLRMDAITTALQTRAIQFYEQALLIDGELQTEEVRVVPYREHEVLLLVRNITDRKQAEAALRESEERSRLAFEAAHMGSWDWNMITNKMVWSASLERLMGIQPGSFDGQFETVIAMIHPDDRRRVVDAMTRSVKQGEAYELEFRFVRPDGTIRWSATKGNVLRDASGALVRMLGVNVDITDRKQAELGLQERVEREQAISRVVQTIRQSLNLCTILTAAATEIAQLLNVDQAAVVQYLPERHCWLYVASYRRKANLFDDLGLEISDEGNPFAAQLKRREIIKVTDAAAIDSHSNQNFARKLPGAWLLVPVIVGDTVWGSFSLRSSQPIACWQDEQVELVQAVADQLAIAIQQAALYQQVQTLNTDLERQVQERTAQLQKALKFEALLKRITDHVRDSLDETQILQTAVQALAIDLAIDCCDAALYDMERRTSTICYEHIRERVSTGVGVTVPFDRNPDLYDQVLRGQSVHCCVTSLTADPCRNIKHISTILICPLMDESGVLGDMWLFKPQHTSFEELEIRLVQQVANQCAIALRQSRLYQAAQSQVEELERLNQLKDDFLSTVSHELRTPMSNIKMATQMLEIGLKPLGVFDDEANPINRYFNILREEGQREIRLINDLLDLARLDAGVEPLTLTSIALTPFLAHLAEPFLERTHKQQQQLLIEVPETLPSLITDRAYLERILTELLQNACKYSPAGETITLAAHATATITTIHVTNSGVTIPAVECDRIFDKFYRIPNNDPWKYGGTGLGLTLVQKLTERLGATIHFTSSDNQTTVTLEFLNSV
ncbi:MAG: PAS domain-containing protein [Tildeniella nuda ZEHNDER 1965/U140]|jgi:PAS domain S-box-containing protein|nr:PAS domain-containing protein [Tildeniella nuda ZEHNDER 1965/U140]